jgi:hypothetical protein
LDKLYRFIFYFSPEQFDERRPEAELGFPEETAGPAVRRLRFESRRRQLSTPLHAPPGNNLIKLFCCLVIDVPTK